MFGLGAFRSTSPLSGGLLWKVPWRLSPFQKYRQRQRLRAVDSVVDTLSTALAKQGMAMKSIERWKTEMPREEEMLPRDKYTMFDRKAKRYRKGIHKLPKWTRVSQRVNPPGY
ncbi:mitochondrial 54s ribosomal protein 31 [Ophiostoma piceae UAMH 11346]|uniref:Large ribosomal subunit protein mL60 n=1 Tax=Ophiostoma piceae (strain UAMH 11346) TaxID=1262450 RepID=S3BPG5_OPHP1|nr:mitochondrial 54s ribosomal protein 31 [Ophiostoma piceae UAMH 11346]